MEEDGDEEKVCKSHCTTNDEMKIYLCHFRGKVLETF
jgi:hypothetical protein